MVKVGKHNASSRFCIQKVACPDLLNLGHVKSSSSRRILAMFVNKHDLFDSISTITLRISRVLLHA